MRITVNGIEREISGPTSVAGLIGELGLSERRVAVELSGRILRPDAFAEAMLSDGDVVEILGFVGGG